MFNRESAFFGQWLVHAFSLMQASMRRSLQPKCEELR